MPNSIQKLIVLLDCPKKTMSMIKEQANNYKIREVDTINSATSSEYDYISREINDFLYSGNDILIVKFSGSKTVSSDIGDEYSEMVITLSCKKNSSFYSDNVVKTFSDMLLVL